jgi:hypothetical protein
LPVWSPDLEPSPSEPPRAVALRRAEDLEKWYMHVRDLHRNLYHVFQGGAILLGALTPVLILVDTLPKALQALPAALSAICVGLIGSFHWKDNWMRCSLMAELVRSERTQFLTGTGVYSGDEPERLDYFVKSLEKIAVQEVSEWRGLHTQEGTPDLRPSQSPGTVDDRIRS